MYINNFIIYTHTEKTQTHRHTYISIYIYIYRVPQCDLTSTTKAVALEAKSYKR